MLEENPNATDHSTILTDEDNAAKVLAYDVAIGWVNPSRIKAADMLALRQFANWMLVKEAQESLPEALKFEDYWKRGFHAQMQLHHTYSMQHMMKNTSILDERERSILGVLRG